MNVFEIDKATDLLLPQKATDLSSTAVAVGRVVRNTYLDTGLEHADKLYTVSAIRPGTPSSVASAAQEVINGTVVGFNQYIDGTPARFNGRARKQQAVLFGAGVAVNAVLLQNNNLKKRVATGKSNAAADVIRSITGAYDSSAIEVYEREVVERATTDTTNPLIDAAHTAKLIDTISSLYFESAKGSMGKTEPFVRAAAATAVLALPQVVTSRLPAIAR